MTHDRRDQTEQPSRAAWAVPLGLGIGGLVVAAIVISVGVGYDVAGRSPPPLVLIGLSLLIGPQFALAYANRPHGGRVEQLPERRPSESISAPIVEAIRQVDAAAQLHGDQRVAQVIREALARLPAHAPGDRLLQLPARRDSDAE